MKYLSDPITQKLSKYIWLFWAVIWASIIVGIGSDSAIGIYYSVPQHEITGMISATLLWGAVVVQTVKILYYTSKSNNLLKIGRWLLLIATSIFAFRMSFMLAIYGTVYASLAATIGAAILAVGLILSSLGVMTKDHFNNN